MFLQQLACRQSGEQTDEGLLNSCQVLVGGTMTKGELFNLSDVETKQQGIVFILVEPRNIFSVIN
jgi:hypothetical protein